MLKAIITKLKVVIDQIELRRNCKKFVAKGNSLTVKGYMRDVIISGECTECEIFVSEGARLENLVIFIKGKGHRLNIGANASVKCGKISLEGDLNNTISIGKLTTIEEALIAATELNSSIIIGEDCMISDGVQIRNGDSHSILHGGKRCNYGGDVIIGNHVWIGTGALILKNVHIGQNSVIGAKSLVSKSFPGASMVGGVPAKLLKTDINWNRKLL